MTFELLVVCKVGFILDDLKELLYEKLSQILSDNLIEFVESTIELFIKISYIRDCETISTTPEEIKRTILGISVELPEEIENIEIVIAEFCSNILDIEQIEHVVKFEDEVLLSKNQQYFQEIFYLEMKLRKIISMIYLHQYSENYFDLLKEEIIKPPAKEQPVVEQMKDSFENEFFHLLFSQYVNLNTRRLPSKTDDFINLIRERNSFDDFLNELNRTPISKKEDMDFLASLKANLEPIEKVRNCVAHNRKIPNKLLQNFNNAKTILNNTLDAYLSEYKI